MSAKLKQQKGPDEEQVVIVIDDDIDIRLAIVELFEASGIKSAAFCDALDFIERGDPHMPGCIVLDVNMPGVSGIEFQGRLADRGCELPIIFVTGHADVPMSVTAMKAGAIDFLLKPFSNKQLLDAVAKAFERDKCNRQIAVVRNAVKENASTLTPREKQVMQHVTNGLMNKQIAYALGVSEIMVKIHRANVMHKMAASSLADLVKKSEFLC
ncbi:response regulator transcription factor [Ensifer adhaerens]|uniref:response regulator transcription factor n=1 Tax=Ensifer canadensis TaxID=555315 RepID=UPI0014902241|nr:response regulator [Ensifer canadensis]NOV20240.1 response regulator transcription factor [Ensifer canadensis]